MLSFLRERIDPLCRFAMLFERYQDAVRAGKSHLAHYYWRQIFYKYNCQISPTAKIGHNVRFPHPIGIVVGDGAIIGDDCVIYQSVTLGKKNGKYPTLQNRCVLYPNAIVIGGVYLHEDTIVGAGAVVTKSTEASHVVLVGVPAKQITRKQKIIMEEV